MRCLAFATALLAVSLGGPLSVRAGQWHLYSVTRSGTNDTFYVDGVSLGTATSSLTVPDANAPLTIGQAEGVGFVNGRLDDVRIYDRALSAAEIVALHAVPEPASILALGIGGGVMLGYVRLRKFMAPRNPAKPRSRPESVMRTELDFFSFDRRHLHGNA